MRKLSKKQVLARIFATFFASTSLFATFNPANAVDTANYEVYYKKGSEDQKLLSKQIWEADKNSAFLGNEIVFKDGKTENDYLTVNLELREKLVGLGPENGIYVCKIPYTIEDITIGSNTLNITNTDRMLATETKHGDRCYVYGTFINQLNRPDYYYITFESNNNKITVDKGYYGSACQFCPAHLFLENQTAKAIANNNNLSINNMKYSTSTDFYGCEAISKKGDAIAIGNSVNLTDIDCEATFSNVYGAWVDGETSIEAKDNTISITNCHIPGTSLHATNQAINSNKIKNNSIVVNGNNNVVRHISNFDNIIFQLDNANFDYPLLTCENVVDNKSTIFTPSVITLENTAFRLKMSESGMNKLLNDMVEDKDKSLVLLLITGDPTAGRSKIGYTESSHNSYYINDIPLKMQDSTKVGDMVRDDLIVGYKFFFVTLNGQLNELHLDGGETELGCIPVFMYRDEWGKLAKAVPDSTELTLVANHKDRDVIYGFKDYYRSYYDVYDEVPSAVTLTFNSPLDLSEKTVLHGSNHKDCYATLNVATTDAKVKGAEDFNSYKFVLASSFADNSVMLSSTNAIDVKGRVIDAIIDENDLPLANRIILMNNAVNTNSSDTKYEINNGDYVLNIKQDDENHIYISKYNYDNVDNQIAIARHFAQILIGKRSEEGSSSEIDMSIDGDSLADELGDLTSLLKIYGKVTGKGEATGANVNIASGLNFSFVSLIGGKSGAFGAETTKDNRVTFNGKGIKFQNISNFQEYNFSPDADTKANDVILTTKNPVSLGKRIPDGLITSVNLTPKEGFTLKLGESLVLLNNARGIAEAQLLLDGKDVTTNPVLYVGNEEKEGSEVKRILINGIGYADNTTGESISIENKDNLYAAYFCSANNAQMEADNRSITFDSSVEANVRKAEELDADGVKHVYGCYSLGSEGDLPQTLIQLKSSVKNDKIYHGGFDAIRGGEFSEGQTFMVSGVDNQVGNIKNFENFYFVLPNDITNGKTMLSVKEKVDLNPTNSIKVVADAEAVASLKGSAESNQFVNLLTAEEIQGYSDQKKLIISSFTDLTAKVELTEDAKVLKFSLFKEEDPIEPDPVVPVDPDPVNPDPDDPDDPSKPDDPGKPDDPDKPDKPDPIDPSDDERPNNQTKAPVEAICATNALINSTNDLVNGDLGKSMAAIAGESSNTFAAMAGGKTRYHSGSHIDSNTWNIGVGIGKKGLSKKNPNSTYGVFFNYGKSNFDTFNDGFVGNGKAKASGLGLMFHSEGKNNYYYNGSAFIGKVKTDWNSLLGDYSDEATYRGFNLTMGHKYELKSNKVVDTYAKYMFSHTNAMNAKMGTYEYNFDAVESSRLRLGFRVECGKDASKARPFYGLAYEREFNSDANASMNLGRVDSPSLKGDTGIMEVGCKWTRGAWDFNFIVEGSIGKREGVTGSFNAYYNF